MGDGWSKLISSGSLGNLGSTLHLVATGDFTGSGVADLLFQDSDGEVEIVGASVAGIVGNPGPSWHVIGTGDYNGDGKSDILFQNSSGEVAIWELNGTTVIDSGSLGNPGPTWHVQPDDGFYQPEPSRHLGDERVQSHRQRQPHQSWSHLARLIVPRPYIYEDILLSRSRS